MAKKKNKLGKLLAFTTTVAAVGGTCYIFRDKIKQCSVYKTATDKLSDLFGLSGTASNDEDDFFFDDEDEDFDAAFSEDQKQEREYTSLTMNSKEEADTKDIVSAKQNEDTASEATDTRSDTDQAEAAPSADEASTRKQTGSDSGNDEASDASKDADTSGNGDS
ncbi:MAG: hypothetical protein IJ801_01870 [Lachnospiraceae bacterium]|nr:hypothetical protein [Lachnospiraceae bacterium]